MHACKLLTVYLVVILTSQTIVLAQNPLRAAPQQTARYQGQPGFQLGNRAEEGMPYQPPRQDTYQQEINRNAIRAVYEAELPPVAIDRNVVPAGFNEIPDQSVSPDTSVTQASRPELLASLSNGSWPDQNRLLDLIMKISMNLVFVLSFAFGLMLFAKRWLRPKTEPTPGDRAPGDSLSIRETLRIDARTSVRLVQWRSNRFLIACDQNGIQSVHALNSSFDQKLRELDDNSVDDKLIRKLLSSSKPKRS